MAIKFDTILGKLREEDTSSSSGLTVTETEIDFGTKPIYDKQFTITDASVSSLSKILPFQSGSVATGRVGDDSEWDSISYSALAGSGSFTLTARASGPIVGKRKVYYSVA